MLKKIIAKAKANKKNQKGFTLIELLAVIVILAILAAIAIPSVISIINKQNDKAAVQDALTAIHAARLYIADHNTTGNQDLGESELKSYIDNSVESQLPGDYEVHYDSSANSYSIDDTKLPTSFGGNATEAELLAFNKSGATPTGSSDASSIADQEE
ncbi:prepilin-type N-terminal cleavage/methylation domain-containing protein [Sporolactobacillus kofuensis]|uniref:Prepilin-type N-terminal cleavage/methylation domain-containing protein n=1 Tax=Sporolactobacillus kofuensis TaxID=269672 RepID=A0ABW1W935_9BACL|nr:prepilin-type N-terminal cleavage/methylation domain-containing protein [Sporolactobacillus kofuensis]